MQLALRAYEGERKKDKLVLPCSSLPQHTTFISQCMHASSVQPATDKLLEVRVMRKICEM